MGAQARCDSGGGMPTWLEVILGEKFFNSCTTHETSKKNEKNVFCIDCCSILCPQCLPPHRSHRLLQVRRYVYNDVVRVDDMEKLIDCSFVQSYITNSAKVIFLNERPQGRAFRGASNACLSCYRALQDPYLFCSLCCKVKQLKRDEGALSRELRECEHLPLPSSCELDDGRLTPDCILESACATSSGSSVEAPAPGATWTAAESDAIVRKKKRSGGAGRRRADAAAVGSPGVNRRKRAVPIRAPLF